MLVWPSHEVMLLCFCAFITCDVKMRKKRHFELSYDLSLGILLRKENNEATE